MGGEGLYMREGSSHTCTVYNAQQTTTASLVMLTHRWQARQKELACHTQDTPTSPSCKYAINEVLLKIELCPKIHIIVHVENKKVLRTRPFGNHLLLQCLVSQLSRREQKGGGSQVFN